MATSMHFAVLLFLAAGDPNEWSTFPTGKPQPAPQGQQRPQAAPAPAPSAAATIPPQALQRYRDAIAAVASGRYGDATTLLNELSGEYPQLAEVYAARCSAQLGLRQAAYAEADCAYALTLKPTLSNAKFGLAEAEEGLGKRDLALRHYREFINDPAARSDLKGEAAKRADGVSRPPPTAADGPPPPPRRSAKSQCLVGKNGRQACGYNCMLGNDGIAACADMPEGDCVQNPDGHVTCAQIAVRGGANAGGQQPDCKAGTDGINVCGYNCKQGTNGRMYCATRPEGQCEAKKDGTFNCP